MKQPLGLKIGPTRDLLNELPKDDVLSAGLRAEFLT